MITNSKQVWQVGETVKVGFLTLRITAIEADVYLLTNKTGSKKYRFVPHLGIQRIRSSIHDADCDCAICQPLLGGF